MIKWNVTSWLRDRRGAAAIECALGTVVMITASILALELYRQVSTQTRVTHSAITLAEYASQDEETQTLFIDRLAEFLHVEQFSSANAAFIVSAVRQDGPTPILLWTREALFGPDAATSLANCGRVAQGGTAVLPAALSLTSGEIVIIAEACVEQVTSTTARVLYAYHITPSRANREPTLIHTPADVET